jgi:proteasome assembly chaperone (PAC2) family protein
MNNIDKRNRLDEAPFGYKETKNNTVFLEYFGKQVKILKGKEAERFLNKINAAKNEKEKQLVMAKITGNFKRGNER